jgi:hypothetical protein
MDSPKVRQLGLFENEAGRALLSSLPAVRFGYGGYIVRQHAQAIATLVRSDVARHQPEVRSQRLGPAADSELGQLSHGLELAAQTAEGDGASRPGFGWLERWKWTTFLSAGNALANTDAARLARPWF